MTGLLIVMLALNLICVAVNLVFAPRGGDRRHYVVAALNLFASAAIVIALVL